MASATSTPRDPVENKDQSLPAFMKKEPYPNLVAEALGRLSGKYVILSPKSLKALIREEQAKSISFTLTQELLSKCVFIQKQAFHSADPDEFRAGIFQPIANPQHSTPALIIEIRYRDRLLKSKEEILISSDLVDAFCPKVDSPPSFNAELVSKCIFIAKSVFEPTNHAKFTYEIASDACTIVRERTQLNKIVSELSVCVSAEIENDPEDHVEVNEVFTIYSIGRA